MPSARRGARTSIYTAMGNPRDFNAVLVFTADGPAFWAFGDPRLENCRRLGNLFYTQEFANAYARKLLGAGGVYNVAFRALRTVWLEKGCQVTQLANRHASTGGGALACDVMESAAMKHWPGMTFSSEDVEQARMAILGTLANINFDLTSPPKRRR